MPPPMRRLETLWMNVARQCAAEPSRRCSRSPRGPERGGGVRRAGRAGGPTDAAGQRCAALKIAMVAVTAAHAVVGNVPLEPVVAPASFCHHSLLADDVDHADNDVDSVEPVGRRVGRRQRGQRHGDGTTRGDVLRRGTQCRERMHFTRSRPDRRHQWRR